MNQRNELQDIYYMINGCLGGKYGQDNHVSGNKEYFTFLLFRRNGDNPEVYV